MFKALIGVLLLSFSVLGQASQLQGYGAFTNLNKDWMLMALYGHTQMKTEGQVGISSSQNPDVQIIPERLEIKIATEKFSKRRFRALWLETLAVEHGTDQVQEMGPELERFFSAFKGQLKRGDSLVLEVEDHKTKVTLDYQTIATLPDTFLYQLVSSLVGTHPPSKALRQGLTGAGSVREQGDLAIRFERLEPTLPRIAQVSRWKRKKVQHLAAQD